MRICVHCGWGVSFHVHLGDGVLGIAILCGTALYLWQSSEVRELVLNYLFRPAEVVFQPSTPSRWW